MQTFTRHLSAAWLALALLAGPAFAYSDADFRRDDQNSQDIYRTGDVQGALIHARGVHDAARAAFGPDAPNTIEAGITLASMMRAVGDDAGALAFLETLYARTTSVLPQNAPVRIKVSVAYANILADMGQAEKALPLHVAAVGLAETVFGPDHDTTLIFQFNLAKTYERLGYGDQALATYNRIADSYDRLGGDTLMQRANVRAQIARTTYQMGRDADAVAAYRTAIPLLVDHWGQNHPYVLSQKLVFGYALWRVAQRDEVTALIGELTAAATLTYGPNSLFHGDLMELSALLNSDGGPTNPQFAESLSLMERSIQIKSAQLDPTHGALGRPMLEYAAMLNDAGEFGQAARLALSAEKAGAASRDLLVRTLVAAADAGHMPDHEAAAELFRIVQQASTSQAGFASLQLAARLSLTQGDDAGRFRDVTDGAARQTVLEAELLDHISRPVAERDQPAEAALRSQIAENAAMRAQAETALFARQPKVADLIDGGVLSVADVQSLLGPEGALVVVDFGTYDDSPGVALSVTEAGVGFAILPFPAAQYAAAVADVRAGISLELGTRGAAPLDDQAPAPRQGFNFPAADWLYYASIGQVFAISDKRKHLYLDLRGPMAAIPPQLLITEQVDDTATAQTAAWLVRDFAITVLPSVFSLKLASIGDGAARARLPLLGFADPVYAQTGIDRDAAGARVLRGALTPLPETADEVSKVAAALRADQGTVRLGPMASEAAVKEAALGNYGILYFATHGLVSGDAVGTSVLGEPALALTGGSGEDGLLTASEIARLRLNADLVVLSACNTAVGDQPGAQALSGLARAFTYAGARSLLVSHWPVESRSAVRMMTDIFDRRADDPTLPVAEAQRAAILSMIDSPPDPAWSHPAYWAPFVLVGDPG